MTMINRRAMLAGLTGAAALSACAPMRGLRRTLCAIDIACRGDLDWGINGHPFTAYPGIPLDLQLDLVVDLGMTQYRFNTRGDGSTAGFDRLLPLAEARGITLLPILYPDANLDEDSPKDLYRKSFDLAVTMARRYEGRIPVWELANELESYAIIQSCEMRDDGTQYPCEWGHAGGVTPLEYYGPRWIKVSAVLKGLSDGVVSTGTRARRAVGTAGWGHLGAFDRMAADGIEWDITVWHDYPGITEADLARLARWKKPIWITEFNAGSGGFASWEENAQRLAERITWYRAQRARYGIQAAHLYQLLDEPYWGDDFEARMGIYEVHPDGNGSWQLGPPKPAVNVVRRILAEPVAGV